MNASRQPFIVSALLAGMLAAACVWRLAVEGSSFLFTIYPHLNPICAAVPAAIVIVWTLVIISQLAIKFAPGAGRNYLPIQLFVVGVGAVAMPSAESLVAVWLVALGVRRAAMSMGKGYRFESVFRAGLYIGLAVLFYAPLLAVGLVFVPAFLIIYKRSWREWVVALVGLVFPLLAAAFIHWTMGAGDFFVRMCSGVMIGSFAGSLSVGGIVVGGILVALGMVCAVCGLVHRKVIRVGPSRFMLSAVVLLAACLGLVVVGGVEAVPLVALAVALVAPYGFAPRWSVVATVGYVLLIVAAFCFCLVRLA